MGDKIRRHHHIHIGIATIEDGLIVPVVKFGIRKACLLLLQYMQGAGRKAVEEASTTWIYWQYVHRYPTFGMMDITIITFSLIRLTAAFLQLEE